MDSLPDVFKCKICLLVFNTEEARVPRVLPACGHTVCEACANRIMRQKDTPNCVECPYDRSVSFVSSGFSASNLPKNWQLVEMVESLRGGAARVAEDDNNYAEDDVIAIATPVVPCFQNAAHEAELFCVGCAKDYCKPCSIVVHTARVLAGHRTVSIDEKPVQVPNCARHPDQKAFFLCEEKECAEPSKLMCRRCKRNSHKTHAFSRLIKTLRKNDSRLKDVEQKLRLAKYKRAAQRDEASRVINAFKSRSNELHEDDDNNDNDEEEELNCARKRVKVLEGEMGRTTATCDELERRIRRKVELYDVDALLATAEEALQVNQDDFEQEEERQ